MQLHQRIDELPVICLPLGSRRLDASGGLGPQAREAIGTKQVLAHLRGEYSADDAMEQVKIETRRFAKNQRTWIRRLSHTPGSMRIAMDPAPDPATTAAAIAHACGA